jgi:hypothetical protein
VSAAKSNTSCNIHRIRTDTVIIIAGFEMERARGWKIAGLSGTKRQDLFSPSIITVVANRGAALSICIFNIVDQNCRGSLD